MNSENLRFLDYKIAMSLFKWQKQLAGAYSALQSIVTMRRGDYLQAKLFYSFNAIHVKPRLRDIPNGTGMACCVVSRTVLSNPAECPTIVRTVPNHRQYIRFLLKQIPKGDVFRRRELKRLFRHKAENNRDYQFCNHPTKHQLQTACHSCECRSVLRDSYQTFIGEMSGSWTIAERKQNHLNHAGQALIVAA